MSSMTANLSRYIPEDTRGNGIPVPIVMQILQIMLNIPVYPAMLIIRQIWIISTGVKMGMPITAHHVFIAILLGGQVNSFI
jgi:hypothetical protein